MSTRERPDRAARRQALLEAAVRVIRRDGPRVSMDRIAAEAGITKPILYRHFGDRNGLVAEVSLQFAADLLSELETALGRADAAPRDLLVSTVDAYLAFVEREPNIYRFVVQRAITEDGTAHEAITGFLRHVGAEVASVIGEDLRARGLDSGPAEPWGFGIVGMVHLAGDWWLDARTMPRSRVVQYLTDLLWGGLAGSGLDRPATTDADGAADAAETLETDELTRRRRAAR